MNAFSRPWQAASRPDKILEISGITGYHPSRTWGPVMALALISLAFAIFLLPGPIGISRTDRVYAALASLLFAFCTASVIKTRLRCDTCMFPYQNRRGSEWIMVPRKAIPLLLSRAPITRT